MAPLSPLSTSLIVGARGLCASPPYRPRRDLTLLTELRRARLFPAVARAACDAGVPVGLLDALIVQESGYDRTARSPKGAMGLTQLMPATARAQAVTDPFDPVASLRGGAQYLGEQLRAFGRADLALAAYNAGPARVRHRMAVPPIAETRRYVTSVTRGWALGLSRAVALSVLGASDSSSSARAPGMGQFAMITAVDGRQAREQPYR